MAEKKTKKKSTVKKKLNDDLEKDDNQNQNNVDLPTDNVSVLKVKNSTPIIEKIKEYKTYNIETEFKLREVFSKDNKIIIGPTRLTRFEKARITGARSLQLSLGAPTLLKIPSDLTDTIMIAKYELEKKSLPISIRRILPNGLYQDIPIDWTV